MGEGAMEGEQGDEMGGEVREGGAGDRDGRGSRG